MLCKYANILQVQIKYFVKHTKGTLQIVTESHIHTGGVDFAGHVLSKYSDAN